MWEPGEVITIRPRTSLADKIEDLLHEFDGVESKRIIADEIANRLLGETEWGWKPDPDEPDEVICAVDETAARERVDRASYRKLARREVSPWVEVPRG
jgi:hypothetical protein